jgi:hypothetical protein
MVENKQSLIVNARLNVLLAAPLSDKLNTNDYTVETKYHNLDIRKYGTVCDINFGYSFYHTENFKLVGGTDRPYFMEVNQLIGGKNRIEDHLMEVEKKFENCNVIKSIPSVWFNFAFMEKTFLERVYELRLKGSVALNEDLEYDEKGYPYMVLRPNNLTHSILAFKVIKPELFRQSLFVQILEVLASIWETRKKKQEAKGWIKSVKKLIHNCGLEAISDTTFGIDGAYASKPDSPNLWGLSFFIKGKDLRTLKIADKIYSHTDWHTLIKQKRSIIKPVELYWDFDDQVIEEITNFMDNSVTPVSGVVDFRLTESGKFYFLETSPSFSEENYDEDFMQQGIRVASRFLSKKYIEVVGNKNDDWTPPEKGEEIELTEKSELSIDEPKTL